MDVNTYNTTKELILRLLGMTEQQRSSVSLQSTCQYIHCTLAISNSNNTCHVTPAVSTYSDEISNENSYAVTIANCIRLYIYPIFIIIFIIRAD